MRHARLGASSAHRWMNCPGSARFTSGLPEIDGEVEVAGAGNEYQRAGTAAHALAEVWLTQGDHAAQNLEQVYVAGSPEPIDDEMREAVGQFVSAVRTARVPGDRLAVEQTFDLAPLNPPEPMFGTADVVLIQGRVLRVFDLKYGQGVIVEVKDNVQLLYYALGAALAELARQLFDPAVKDFDETQNPLDAALALFDVITVTIVQPRAGHIDGPVRTVEVTPGELREFADFLMERAYATQSADAPLEPGPWCRFCPAQGHCPALQQHAQLVAQVDFDQVPVDTPVNPETLPIAVAADLLSKVEVLEIWIRALYERVTRALEAGEDVPGWKLVPKRARRVWHDPKKVAEWAVKFGLVNDQFYDTVLKSPAQLEKIVGKKHLPEELYARVSSGLTLVPASDPRPAAAIGPQEDFAALPRGSIEADLVVQE